MQRRRRRRRRSGWVAEGEEEEEGVGTGRSSIGAAGESVEEKTQSPEERRCHPAAIGRISPGADMYFGT